MIAVLIHFFCYFQFLIEEDCVQVDRHTKESVTGIYFFYYIGFYLPLQFTATPEYYVNSFNTFWSFIYFVKYLIIFSRFLLFDPLLVHHPPALI